MQDSIQQEIYHVVLTGSYLNQEWGQRLGTYPKQCNSRKEAQTQVIMLNRHHVRCRIMTPKEFADWEVGSAEVLESMFGSGAPFVHGS